MDKGHVMNDQAGSFTKRKHVQPFAYLPHVPSHVMAIFEFFHNTHQEGPGFNSRLGNYLVFR